VLAHTPREDSRSCLLDVVVKVLADGTPVGGLQVGEFPPVADHNVRCARRPSEPRPPCLLRKNSPVYPGC
jgi:hypothetical protein